MRWHTTDTFFLILIYTFCSVGVGLAYTFKDVIRSYAAPNPVVEIQDARANPPDSFRLVGRIIATDPSAHNITVRTYKTYDRNTYHDVRIELDPGFYSEYAITDASGIITEYVYENQNIHDLPTDRPIWLSYRVDNMTHKLYSDGVSF